MRSPLARFQAYTSGMTYKTTAGAKFKNTSQWGKHDDDDIILMTTFFRQQGGPIFSPRLQTLLFKVFSSVSLVLEVGSQA